jgi:transcriptional regulator with XRE-family HTH domain
MTSLSPKSTFGKRFKQARTAAGLSQKSLGIKAGLDEFVASTRINRYEQGVHDVDLLTAHKLARALDVPLAFFYVEDDQLAELILRFPKLDARKREKLLKLAQEGKSAQES